MARPRLVLVEDHRLVREELRAMLEPSYEIVATLPDAETVVAAVQIHRPDAVLLDLSLPGRGGMEALTDLVTADPEVRVVVVTMHADRVLANMAFRLGALAFVPKDAPIAHLHEAIGEVLQRRRYLSPAVSTRPSRDPGTEALGFGLLTSRQQQIVRLIGQGLTSEQIAQKLGVSFHTINFHRKNLRRQLGIHSDWEMRRYALLVDLTDGSGSPGDDGVPSPAVPPSSGLPGSGPTGTADQPAQD